MKPDLKQFVKALREKDIKKAREELDGAEHKLDLNDEFWCGYYLALRGMVSALESGDELTVLSRIINGKIPRESIQRLIRQTQEKSSQTFRQNDERGFDAAWADALQFFQAKG